MKEPPNPNAHNTLESKLNVLKMFSYINQIVSLYQNNMIWRFECFLKLFVSVDMFI